MPDKKIVDDYYSQIKSDNSDSNSKNGQKKPKIVAKKKIIVKKPKPKTDPKKEGTASFDKNKNSFKKKNNFEKKKPFVQKLEVVKRTDDKPKKFTIVKRGEPGHGEANRNRKNNFNRSKNSENKQEEKPKFKIRGTGNSDEARKFKDNKKASRGSNYNKNEPRKSALAGGQRRTRGRFDFNQNRETTFIRSKVNKNQKKEEKKIEDIKQNLIEKKGQTIVVSDILTLKELSEKIGVVLPKLMAEFMKNGMMVNINSKIDFDSASIIAEAFEIKLDRDTSVGASAEDIMSGDIREFLKDEDSDKLQLRTPVVSIMGHVDHGKTSLLDYIREAKIADGEAGGITQSIGAYQAELNGKKITFLDTPGHEAFTLMRARGARSTDIAILVVAADEGVKPQTIESINHAKEAGIPVIVAINKMDKQGANPDHVKGQLAEHGLTAEDWGGDTPMVPVSAHSGFGVDDLLEIILLVAEMNEMKANPDRFGIATIIESHLDQKLGPVAVALINTGKINMGDNIVCQDSYGKIKILKNYKNQSVKFALPGEPVLIVGLDKVVVGGDILQVVNTVEIAKQKAEEYKELKAAQKKDGASGLALLMSKIKSGNLKQLKIILKADTNGSLEAIRGALLKLSTEETEVQVIHAGVGAITESDALMGQGSNAILVGFNVGVLPTAKSSLEDSGVDYIASDIIYHITEKIEKIVTGMLDPKEIEIELGKAKVGGIFFTGKGFMIIGLKIGPDSVIEKNALVRIIRKKKIIGNGTIDSLKSGMIEVNDLEGPIECGINIKTNILVEMGDDIEIHKTIIEK